MPAKPRNRKREQTTSQEGKDVRKTALGKENCD
jgi:hypothetical protein